MLVSFRSSVWGPLVSTTYQNFTATFSVDLVVQQLLQTTFKSTHSLDLISLDNAEREIVAHDAANGTSPDNPTSITPPDKITNGPIISGQHTQSVAHRQTTYTAIGTTPDNIHSQWHIVRQRTQQMEHRQTTYTANGTSSDNVCS